MSKLDDLHNRMRSFERRHAAIREQCDHWEHRLLSGGLSIRFEWLDEKAFHDLGVLLHSLQIRLQEQHVRDQETVEAIDKLLGGR